MIQRPNKESGRKETLNKKHMELMQARLTALKPPHRPLTDNTRRRFL